MTLKNKIHINNGVTTALWVVVMLVLSACGSSIKNDSQLNAVRDSVAVMKSYGVTTLISDSGITRYRVVTPEWLVYDKTSRPSWLFPQGLHLEQFDKEMQVHSEVSSKHAVYYVNEDVWELSDSVVAMNVEGELFETNSLRVEQKKDLIYTDEFVKITQKKRIISGYGMRANQRLTRYTILKTQGVIPLDENNADSTQVNDL
jgi:LPS export ABC transporter protein LptC